MTPPTDDTRVILSDRYRLESRIGTGGAGAVWRAFDTVLARDVAVKLLHADLERDGSTRERFRREATAAASIHHPHAAVVYDIGEDDGRNYLVMELVDGPSLADVLDGSPIDPEVVVAVGHQVAGALGAAHERGLAHRDIKPANILLTSDGSAKVVDFGIAKALGEVTQQLTATGTVVGTAMYLAPEQLEAGGDVDGRADVYALGLVLHQLLTGRPPFSGGTAVEVAAKRLVSDAPRPSQLQTDIPDVIDDIVAKATRLDPSRRFADGRAFAAALAAHVPDRATQLVAELAHRDTGALERTRRLTVVEPEQVETRLVEPTTPVEAAAPTPERTPSPPAPPPAPADPDATAAIPRAATPHETAAIPRTPVPDTTPRTETARRDPLRDEVLAEEPEPRRRALWISLAVVTLAAVLAASLSGAGGGGGSPDVNGGGGEDPSAPYRIADGADFDPFGGDGEHPEDVPSAFDGNPGTAWTTQRYNSADFGGLKPGVGLMLDLGESVEVSQVQLLLATAGIDLEIHVSDQPFSGGELGEPVATLADAPAEPTIDVGGATGRYWLVWVTSVPGGRAQIAEVEFDRP